MKTPSAKKPSKKKSTINGGQQKEKATKEDKAKGKVLKKEVEEQVKVEDELGQGQPGVATQNSSQSATDSRSLALQRLSAVSNFLASRHHDANSEPIFLESSESAGEADTSMGAMISLTLDTRTNESKRVASPTTTITTTTTTKPTTTTTNTTNLSLSGSSTQLPRESSTSSDCRSKSKQLTSETQQELEEPSWWQDTSLQINTASALDRGEMPYRLRHIDSGDEQAWWLRGGGEQDEDDTLAEESHNPLDDEQDVSAATTQQGWWSSEEKQQQNGHASLEQEQQLQQEEEEEEQEQTRHMPRSRISPEHAAWWLDEEQQQQESHSSKQNGYHKQHQEQEQQPATDAHVEVTIKLPSSGSSSTRSKLAPSQSSDSNGHWWLSGPAKKLFNVQRVESGERAWWQEKENEPPAAVQAQAQAPPTPPPRIIKHWESGERAWWLQEEEPEVEEAEVTSTLPPPGQDELDNQLSSSFNFSYSVRPPPLGQCASPVPPEQAELAEAEQLLAEEQRKLCASPYDNIPMSKVQKSLSPPAAAQSAAPSLPARYSCHYTPPPPARVGEKLFISRHQNIDELLGGACRPLSPLFLAAAALESSAAAAEPPAAKNMFLLEEITPDQVRIHDSTAQLPVIQRMQR